MALIHVRRPAAVYELVEEEEFFATAESGVATAVALPQEETIEPDAVAPRPMRARPRAKLRWFAVTAIAAASVVIGFGLNRPTTPPPLEQIAGHDSSARRPAPKPGKQRSSARKRVASRPRNVPARLTARPAAGAAPPRQLPPTHSPRIVRPAHPAGPSPRAAPPARANAAASNEFGFEQ